MDKHPEGTIHRLNGQHDAALRELLLLLLGEAEVGGMHGNLYLDSLSTALATRLIYASRSAQRPQISRVSSLPRRNLTLHRSKQDRDSIASAAANEFGRYGKAKLAKNPG
jgi:hypothetical protein